MENLSGFGYDRPVLRNYSFGVAQLTYIKRANFTQGSCDPMMTSLPILGFIHLTNSHKSLLIYHSLLPNTSHNSTKFAVGNMLYADPSGRTV